MNKSELVTTKTASLRTGYTTHNITKLARERKVKAKRIGPIWLIDINDLLHHKHAMELLGTAKHIPYKYRIDGKALQPDEKNPETE